MYRVLIADDENIECEGVAWLLRKYFPQLEILPFASNGLELVQSAKAQRPDLILMDISMPGITGLEALEILRIQNSAVKVIVISAYSNFSYAQQALRLEASEYLLKPVEETAFIAAVKKQLNLLEHKILQNETTVRKVRQDYRELLEDTIMTSLILGTREPVSLLRNLTQWGADPDSGCMVCSSHNLFLDAVAREKIAEWKKEHHCLVKIHKKSIYFCLFPGITINRSYYKKWITDLFQVPSSAAPKHEFPYALGVSSLKYNVSGLYEAVNESITAFYKNSGTGICFFESEPETGLKNEYEQFYNQYLNLALHGLKEKCRHTLSDFMNSLSKTVFPSQLQICCCDFLLRLTPHFCDAAMETGEIFWYYWKKFLPLSDSSSIIQNLNLEASKILKKNTPVKKQCHRYLEICLRYMRKNYMHDLSLDETAAQASITPFYLSRLFRQDLDQTFLESLTDIRIEKAIELLYQNYNARTVCDCVGYPNSNYFHRLFKDRTGITIGQFKTWIRQFSAHTQVK